MLVRVLSAPLRFGADVEFTGWGKSRNAFAKSAASENDLLSRLQTATCSTMILHKQQFDRLLQQRQFD